MSAAVVLVDAKRALRLAALAGAAVALVAAVIHVTFAAEGREFLRYGFPGVEPQIGEALSIFANNARKAAGIFGLALVLQSPWLSGERPAGDRPEWHRTLARLCDFGVIGVLGSTVVAVTVGVGAYGERMVRAVLPHGPLEFFAFALAVVLYLAARRGPVGLRRAVTTSAACAATLAVAALVETYLPI